MQVGRVGKPHGLDGSFYVTRPEEGVLVRRIRVHVGGDAYLVERVAGTAARPILRLQGVSSREAVEPLRGQPVEVTRGDVPPLQEGEYWADDLVGLAVVDGERSVGAVDRVRALPSCEVLEVGELLIPLVGDAVRDIDLQAGRIDVDLAFLGES